MSRPAIILIGSVPPPVHGQSIMTANAFAVQFSAEIDKLVIDLPFSRATSEIGTCSLRKVGILLHGIVAILRVRLATRGSDTVLYYCAGSAHWCPLIRDAILLGIFGRLFHKRIIHYHSGGLPEWFSVSWAAATLGRLAYAGAVKALMLTREVPVPSYEGTREALVPNGLKLPHSICSGDQGQDFRFLYMGRLCESKGVRLLLQAVERLHRGAARDRKWTLTLAGDWKSQAEQDLCLAAISDDTLRKRVVFLGVVTDREKWRTYRRADAFVFPSFYESETQPLVLIEAFAASLPVLASRWRGIPEMVEDGKNGFLVRPGCLESTLKGMLRLLDASGANQQMGARNRKRYLSEYSIETFQARLRAELEGVLSARGLRGGRPIRTSLPFS